MATEKQLKDLNEIVYSVNPNFKDNGKTVKQVEKNTIFETTDTQRFKVLSVKNGDYSFQGIAVAPKKIYLFLF